MKEYFLHINLTYGAAILLAVFLFLFLHSEFDLFSPENHTHTNHDFCQLIDGSTNKIQKLVNYRFFKSNIAIDFLFFCSNAQSISQPIILSKAAEFISGDNSSSPSLYLTIRVLLI